MSNESKPLIYPCKECEGTTLLHIAGIDDFVECSKCECMQKKPSEEEIKKYNNL